MIDLIWGILSVKVIGEPWLRTRDRDRIEHEELLNPQAKPQLTVFQKEGFHGKECRGHTRLAPWPCYCIVLTPSP